MAGELQPPSAEEAGRELADRLDARGVPYAIGGALSLAQWGIPRGTVDVDLNIWVDPARPTSAAQLLGDLGCELKSSAVIRAFADRGWAYAFYRGVHVDFYLPVREFHAEVLRRRRQRPLLGREAWFLTPEDLAVFKLILYRAKDLADLESLAVLNARSLDAAYVRTWISALAGANDVRVATWDELVAAADRAARLRESGWRPPGEE